MAVGYCTLYGDMAGGLAVISDVSKTMVYDLARLVNREANVIPEEIITKAPLRNCAPIKPIRTRCRRTTCSIAILKAYVEDLQSPAEIAERCGFPLELVRSVASSVDRNEYKRKQAPPGLKVTWKSFGVGRRFPVAQKFSIE